MSELRPGDQRLHYSDNSHRWIAPHDVDQNVWNAGMRAHLDLHLATMGGPMEPMAESRACARRPAGASRPAAGRLATDRRAA
jgi:hypothetical protein